jgi:hypothetical protein
LLFGVFSGFLLSVSVIEASRLLSSR